MVAILWRLESGAQPEMTCNQALLLMIVSHVLFEALYNEICFFEDYTFHQGLLKGFSKSSSEESKAWDHMRFFFLQSFIPCVVAGRELELIQAAYRLGQGSPLDELPAHHGALLDLGFGTLLKGALTVHWSCPSSALSISKPSTSQLSSP